MVRFTRIAPPAGTATVAVNTRRSADCATTSTLFRRCIVGGEPNANTGPRERPPPSIRSVPPGPRHTTPSSAVHDSPAPGFPSPFATRSRPRTSPQPASPRPAKRAVARVIFLVMLGSFAVRCLRPRVAEIFGRVQRCRGHARVAMSRLPGKSTCPRKRGHGTHQVLSLLRPALPLGIHYNRSHWQIALNSPGWCLPTIPNRRPPYEPP